MKEGIPVVTDSLKRVSETEFTPAMERVIDSSVADLERRRPKLGEHEGRERVLLYVDGGKRRERTKKKFTKEKIESDLKNLESKKSPYPPGTPHETVAAFERGKRLSEFMESTFIKEYREVFPGKVELYPVSEFTDRVQKVDAVMVVRDDSGGIDQLLALDFTYADSPEELSRKLVTSLEGVVQGTLASARYLEIDGKSVEIEMMPKIVVPFSDGSVFRVLRPLSLASGRRKVTLKSTPQTDEFLELARAQVRMQLEVAKTVSDGRFTSFGPFERKGDDAVRQREDMVAMLQRADEFLSRPAARPGPGGASKDLALKNMRTLLSDASVSARGRLLKEAEENIDERKKDKETVPAGDALMDIEEIDARLSKLIAESRAQLASLEAALASGSPDKAAVRTADVSQEQPDNAPAPPDAEEAARAFKKQIQELKALEKKVKTGKKVGGGHGHTHGIPLHLPNTWREWGSALAAPFVAAWNGISFTWKFGLYPLIHGIGYVITGDPKSPWKSLWSGIVGDFKKAFKIKGGGGSHGGGGHDHGGHDDHDHGGHGGGGHH